jgi:TetR/AcrR family transcriptional repressor of nem operon
VSKRDDILSAARDLLWERGFEATSPRAVMDRSGAGQGSLYHHFATKKRLAVAALDEVEERLTGELAGTLGDGTRPPLERVLAWLAAPRDALRGCRLGRLGQESSVVEDDELRQPVARFFEGLERRLRETLAEAVAAGELPKETDVGDLAALLVAVVQGGYVASRVLNDPGKLEDATRAAHALLINAVGSKNG